MKLVKDTVAWLKEGGARDPKHRGWLHPLVTGFLTTLITLLVLYGISQWVISEYKMEWEISDKARWTVGWFLIGYYLFLIIGRSTFMRTSALYDMLWTCNITMLTAGIGFLLKNPVMTASAFSTILVDQMLWYIDIFGFIFFRKWPIGVAKYLVSKETPLLKKLTSSHHLWFEPLCFTQLHNLGYPTIFFWVAMVYSFILGFCSRAFSPKEIIYPVEPHNKKDDRTSEPVEKKVYLNVNLCHECWPDMRKFKFLTIADEKITKENPALLVCLLIFFWNVFNFPWFFLIQAIFYWDNFKNNFSWGHA